MRDLSCLKSLSFIYLAAVNAESPLKKQSGDRLNEPESKSDIDATAIA